MFTQKMVAVMNKALEPGVVMNALAHASLGLGARGGSTLLRLDTYVDKEGCEFSGISQMPFIILSANSNKIKNLYQWAKDNDILHVAFLDSMTGGGYKEQLAHCQERQCDNHVFYGIVMIGPEEKVNEATKKFSLWR